ncbi:nucleotide-binding domain containing protein [Bacillus sp. N9]
MEFNIHLVMDDVKFNEEMNRIQQILNTSIVKGISVCVYTSRERLDLEENRKEEELAISVKIANAVTSFVHECKSRPRFVVAKGGITSSDVGTVGLEVKRQK